MSANTLTQDSRRIAAEDIELEHLVCCDEDRTLCGLDASEIPWNYNRPVDCAVCRDLDGQPCSPECQG